MPVKSSTTKFNGKTPDQFLPKEFISKMTHFIETVEISSIKGDFQVPGFSEKCFMMSQGSPYAYVDPAALKKGEGQAVAIQAVFPALEVTETGSIDTLPDQKSVDITHAWYVSSDGVNFAKVGSETIKEASGIQLDGNGFIVQSCTKLDATLAKISKDGRPEPGQLAYERI